MLKNQFVRDLAVDTVVDSVFKVTAYDARPSKHGDRYLSLSLADRTGRILAKRWDVDAGEVEHGRTLRYVHVRGVVEEYRGGRQIRIDFPLEDAALGCEPADYEAVAALTPNELRTRLDALICDVAEPHLARLLAAFFGDAAFRERFDEAPAAKGVHHACRHGLMQHTVEVAEMVRAVVDLQRTWGYAPVSRDLAIAGALLHDIGKVRELDWSEPAYEYTVTGGLIGHIAIGYQMVFTKILLMSSRGAERKGGTLSQTGAESSGASGTRLGEVPGETKSEDKRTAAPQGPHSGAEGFPAALRDALLHIILAHHGKLEHGSPVPPMLREARIVATADDLDVRLFCMTEAALASEDKDFGWHRAVEGGRVYAGSLGLAAEALEPAEPSTEIADPPDEQMTGTLPPALTAQIRLDLANPAAAILNAAGKGAGGRIRRRP